MFNIDPEKGKGSEAAEDLPAVDYDDGVYDSKYEDGSMRYGEVGYARRPKESGMAAEVLKALAIDTPSPRTPPGCQWLVPYGTFLTLGTNCIPSVLGDRNRKASAESQNDHDSRTSSIERSEKSGFRIVFYSTVFRSSEYLAQVDIENERRARMSSVQEDHLTPWEFCTTRHILALYPLRYDMRKAILNGALDDQNLAGLCEEVRDNLQATVVPSWEHLTTLIPLIEERLLCATGDPELRLDACWDRRPRGTFLDFGWTREKPDMPKDWSFFAHCKPEMLMSILIEVIEAVEEASIHLVERWSYRANNQAWYTIRLGAILERCYARRLLLQPQPDDISKYHKHMLYVLAATELTNTCFKSRQVRSLANVFSGTMLQSANVDGLLQTPLSEILDALLCDWRSTRSTGARARSSSPDLDNPRSDVFSPSNLEVPVLRRIGWLKVDWTEYMEEHLKFDPGTMTVYVYWFFSHISDNASWQ
ncbi:hypothetical protein DL98DRAFT_512115 [Cadophora sp. DSE1049]|nr:hypothetical protein DL98DRAFT_512115 [Cadophora sp. DSE1049]